MVRNDFVSNSSSCSFIITNPKDICDKVSLDDLNLLFSTIPAGRRMSYDNGSIVFRSQKDSFSKKILDYFDNKESRLTFKKDEDNYITIAGVSIYDLSVPDIDFITNLFKESDTVEFNHGLDDCGMKSSYVGAIVGVLIDHIPEVQLDSEEFDVYSIIEMFKNLKETRK